MALSASKTQVTLREVVLKDKPEEMISVSLKASVPVLVMGETIIDESLEIMHWALRKNDPEDWLRSVDDPLIEENDGPFKHHLDRYKYSTRYEGAVKTEHRDAGVKFLEKLEARMTDKVYLCGAILSFTDIAIFPFVRQFRIADATWFDDTPFLNVQRWLNALNGTALFKSVMKKYPAWKPAGQEFLFP